LLQLCHIANEQVNMKCILVAVFSALLSQAISAADLTGRWVAETQGRGGEKRQTVFVLQSDGDKLGGYLVSTQGDDYIAEGKIAGDAVSFTVIGDFYGQERRTQYTAKITDAGLLFSMPAGPGGAPRELLAKRVSTEAPKLLSAPPRIALPRPPTAVPSNGLA